jgi:anti-sigma factor RsiW
METDSVHELTAAYALDALSPDEAEAYEAHLAECARCREELAALGEAATALAHGAVAPTPPPELRERILQAAAADRPNVVPLLRRRPAQALVGVAAATAAVAVGLGLWASSLHDSLQRERSAAQQLQAAVQVLGRPDARRVALSGRQGALYVTSSGEGALVLERLPRAPKGHTYEAWVVRKGTPAPAGLFAGGGELTAVRLRRPVPAGAAVAVTIESAGGARVPQGPRIAAAPA